MFRRLSSDDSIDLSKSGIAFVLVIFAGASTALGASVVFEQRLVRLASRRVLAAALAFSAGVMMYVSFIEIFPESKEKFVEAGLSEEQAYGVTTLCFFLGIAALRLLFALVHCIDKNHDMFDDVDFPGCSDTAEQSGQPPDLEGQRLEECQKERQWLAANQAPPQLSTTASGKEVVSAPAAGELVDFGSPSSSLVRTRQQQHQQHQQQQHSKAQSSAALAGGRPCSQWLLSCLHLAPSAPCAPSPCSSSSRNGRAGRHAAPSAARIGTPSTGAGVGNEELTAAPNAALVGLERSDPKRDDNPDSDNAVVEDARQLREVGLMTAVAIAIHNLPEGLATYVGYLTDPSVGVTLAIAIAIHNIPEGLCVALPIYYATGSRVRGFLFAMASGAAEPLGALLGFVILQAGGQNLHGAFYGVIFAMIAGMMVMICVLELIPTANRHDPHDKVTTPSLVCGMAVMALSLCLFKI